MYLGWRPHGSFIVTRELKTRANRERFHIFVSNDKYKHTMALLPYWFGRDLAALPFSRRRTFSDRLLDFDLSDDFEDIFDRPALQLRRYIRPSHRRLGLDRDVVSSKIKSDKDKFQVNLDVQHFSPEEISVKTADGYVIIEGKHEERQDDHGFVSRQFTRRYALPEDCNPETVESKLSSDGVLAIIAPRASSAKNERAVPITHTGPIRKKHNEEEMINDEHEEETKSPQKKRRR